MNEPPQFAIQTAKGLATYPARGSVDAPFVLRNALLRPGGWSCAPAAQLIRDGVKAAAWAGWGADLFVQTGDGLQYFESSPAPHFTAIPGAGHDLALQDAVLLAPRLLYSDANGQDLYINPDFGAQDAANVAVFTEWDGTGDPPAGPWYRVTVADPRSVGGLPAQQVNRVRLVPVRGPDAPAFSPYRGVTEISLPALPGNNQRNVEFGNVTWPVNVYYDGYIVSKTTFNFWCTNLNGNTITPRFLLAKRAEAPVATDVMYVKPHLAEYHQGRVWAVGTAQIYDPTSDAGMKASGVFSRVYFSEVIAKVTADAQPFFAEDYYFDVPFRASREIRGLVSVGRYLYILGDREAFIMTGNDDQSWTLESLGESIGTLSPASVQRLQNVVFYLSDSGVMALSGGQAVNVGEPVRDLVKRLNLATLTSSVDYERELYYLTDGVTTLVYHQTEQGWTTRDPDGADQRLTGSNGTPYSVHAGGLYSLDSTERLTLRASFGPFGQPGQRRRWHGVTGAVDSSAGASVTVQVDGVDLDTDFLPVTVTGEPQTRPAYAGLTPFCPSLENNTAALVTLHVTLTPEPGTQRCILRPPLVIVGSGGTEAWA